MSIFFTFYAFILFFVLTPNILLYIPAKGSKVIVALVHGLIFSAVLVVSEHFIKIFGNRIFEGVKLNTKTKQQTTNNKQQTTNNKHKHKDKDKNKQQTQTQRKK
jgi:hypothetical protein